MFFSGMAGRTGATPILEVGSVGGRTRESLFQSRGLQQGRRTSSDGDARPDQASDPGLEDAADKEAANGVK